MKDGGDPDVPPTLPTSPTQATTALRDAATPTAKIAVEERTPPPPDAWDRGAAWLMAHGPLPALALLTVVVAIIYGGVFRGEVAGDDLTFHLAESRRIADCLRAGDFDFWNPSANAGYASAYYYQVLPQLASALPAALFGHHLFWFELSVWLPLVLAPAAAYRGIRLMGASPWQAVVAAFAIAFTIGESRWGFSSDGTFSVGLYTQTWALAAFPIALGHAVRWGTTGKGLAPAVAWGAFVGLLHPFAVIALGFALLFGFVGQCVLWCIDLGLRALGRSWHPDAEAHPTSAALAARWRDLPPRPVLPELLRLALYAPLLGLSLLPVLLPLVVDYAGFGGFPHRVDDEVGPGFHKLMSWYAGGKILDYGRFMVLTWTLPIAAIFARTTFMRWLWSPALAFALLLGIGPHLGKTADDLIPAVRFLGAMQIVLALGIGAGLYMIGATLWEARETSLVVRIVRRALGATGTHPAKQPLDYAIRTALAAIAAALVVLVAVPGARFLAGRVHVLSDYPGSHRDQMMEIIDHLGTQPPGRKQVGPGCENHWWNLLSYEYTRRPSLFQMGGGGLQSSPNYDYLWSNRDYTKNAWLYDAPYLVFDKSKASTMPIGEIVQQTETYEVRKLPAPGLVSPVQVTGALPPGRKPAHAAALEWIKTDLPLKDRVLVYDEDAPPGREPAGKTLRSFRQDSPGDEADILAEVEVTATTTFMARESWHPRWHVYIDGVEARVRRVTPDFPAVDVPPGKHVLAFRFERPWWAHASWLAWPGLALLAWLLERAFARHRRATPTSPPTA